MIVVVVGGGLGGMRLCHGGFGGWGGFCTSSFVDMAADSRGRGAPTRFERWARPIRPTTAPIASAVQHSLLW